MKTSVIMVIVAMETLPGTEEGSTRRERKAAETNRAEGRYV